MRTIISLQITAVFRWGYDKKYVSTLPSPLDAKKIASFKKRSKRDIFQNDLPYFATTWLFEAKGSVDNVILANYLKAPFIAYDHLERFRGNSDHGRLQDSLGRFENLAFVYSKTMDGLEGVGLPKARIITSVDKDFEVLKFDANDVIVKTAFANPVFLVRTQNYHSQWQAFIDGKPAELLRTNICFQGLWVPAEVSWVENWHFGAAFRYIWAYFLVFLYFFVLAGLIGLWLRLTVSK